MPIRHRTMSFPRVGMPPRGLRGISRDFSRLSPCGGQVAYVLLTRAPVAGKSQQADSPAAPRLACVKPVASVHPEPGSNSSLLYLVFFFFLALNTRPRGLRHGSLRATLARHSTVCPNPVAPESLLFIASTFQYDLSRVKLKLLTETSSRHCLCHLVSNLFLRTTFVLFARISMTFPLPLPSVLMPRRSRKRVQNYTFSPNWQNLSQYFFRLFSHPPPQLPTNQPITPQNFFSTKKSETDIRCRPLVYCLQ